LSYEACRGSNRKQQGNEEKFDLKRMFLRSILALIPAALIPLSAAAQVVVPDTGSEQAAKTEPAYKYEVYAGFGYSSINQVTQSRHGLAGVDLSVTREWGRYFGLSGIVNYYKPEVTIGKSGTGTGSNTNPGNPSVYEALVGPEIHATLYDNLSGFIHGGFGVAHTGGEGMSPDTSFAGGFGGGMTYNFTPRLGIRLSGDRIGASFPVNNNPKGYSPHRTWNASATIGVVYHF
jgi:hypothetical protein